LKIAGSILTRSAKAHDRDRRSELEVSIGLQTAVPFRAPFGFQMRLCRRSTPRGIRKSVDYRRQRERTAKNEALRIYSDLLNECYDLSEQ
jgi:hypothetical protein